VKVPNPLLLRPAQESVLLLDLQHDLVGLARPIHNIVLVLVKSPVLSRECVQQEDRLIRFWLVQTIRNQLDLPVIGSQTIDFVLGYSKQSRH